MVTSTYEKTFQNGGRPLKVVVKFRDDAYKDCTPEEIKARRKDFEETALRLANKAMARAERQKAAQE